MTSRQSKHFPVGTVVRLVNHTPPCRHRVLAIPLGSVGVTARPVHTSGRVFVKFFHMGGAEQELWSHRLEALDDPDNS